MRTVLPERLPRPLKLARNRGGHVLPPAHIRVAGVSLSTRDREYIARKLGRQFARFASSIERITVRLSDANGPKGGRDQVCQIKVVLSGLPSVFVEERDSTARRAVDRAIKPAARAVRGRLQRRRLMPIRRPREVPATAS